MNKPRKHAEVIKAWADGAEVERRCNPEEKWEYVPCPSWNQEFEYRIKPQPKIVKMYMHYDELTRQVNEGYFDSVRPKQFMFEDNESMDKYLEWTFTDGVLTSVEIVK